MRRSRLANWTILAVRELGGHFLGKVADLRGFSEPLPALAQGFRGEILGRKVVVQHINTKIYKGLTQITTLNNV